MKFTPSSTYVHLKRQADAMCSLVTALEATVAILQSRVDELSEERVIKLENEIESEKDMNDILTRELEEGEVV